MNEVRVISTLKDNVSGQLAKMQDKFDTLGKSKGFQSIVSGVGVGIGVAVWQQATSKIVGFIGDAKEAALAEEESIQKLGTALRANVKDWDGNTAAIERVLKARMDLGFSDDEQRDSLAKLVAATRDVNKALEIQRTAMDLARFKGISLADATDALTKVEAGSFRILKSLGIALQDGATQTEALAAVQRVAAGQAADYANTNRGKLLKSQVELDEAMETFGAQTLPLAVGAMETAAKTATGLAAILELVTKSTEHTSEENDNLGRSFIDAAKGWGPWMNFMASVAENIANTGKVSEVAMEGFAAKAHNELDSAGHAMDNVGKASHEMRRDIVGDAKRAGEAFEDLRETMADEAQGMIDDYFDPIEQRAALHDTRLELFAAEEAARTAKTKEAHQDASADIVEALDDEASGLAKLGAKGKLTNKDIDKFATDAKRNYKNLSKDAREKIDAIIARLRLLASFKTVAVNVRVGMNQGNMGNGGARAAGGPVDANKVYRVGEKGPEWFVSDEAGTIIPNGGGSGGGLPSSSGSGGDLHVHFHGLVAAPTPGDTKRIASALGPAVTKWQQQQGHLARTGTGLRG